MDHQIFVICGTAQRLDLNGLVIDLAECAGIGANEQQLELFLQAFLLLRGGFAPAWTCGQRGHAAEIDMLHQLAVDQLHDLVDVATLDAFVGANGIQSFVGNAFHKSVWRLIGRQNGS